VASTDVWLTSTLDRGIELRSAAGAATTGVVWVVTAVDVTDDVTDDVTSASAVAVLSTSVCKNAFVNAT